MAALAKQRLNVDQFLVWAEGQIGRFELDDGEVIAMSPERARHAETKYLVQRSLERAIERAGLPCRMMPDGMTVRVDEYTAYEPDALVYCGSRIDGDDVEVRNPIIIVEVSSPSTRALDAATKLAGYFRVASVMHYLIVDPRRQIVIHHKRGVGEVIDTRIVATGRLNLSPPGLELDISEFFADA